MEILWTLEHLPDLESDFSVFHRVDDVYSMPGPRFFQMAYRLNVYGGMVTALRAVQAAVRVPEPEPMPILPFDVDPTKQEVVVVPATPAGIESSDLRGLVSWGKG